MYSFCQAANGAPPKSPEQNLHAGGLSIRSEWFENSRATVVYVTGNIDWTTAADLRFEILQRVAFDSPSQVIVDLEGVHRVDSSGVGTLVESWHKTNENGIRFALSGVSASLRRVLERIRLDTLFDIRNPFPDTQVLGSTR